MKALSRKKNFQLYKFSDFRQKSSIQVQKKAFYWSYTIWCASWTKFATFTDFEEIQAVFEKKNIVFFSKNKTNGLRFEKSY